MKNSTTNDKAAKRPYVKKTLRTQDELWKAIIPALWAPFILFCLEDWADKIDFTHKPDFLDKELKRLMLRAKSKNRTVDFLMRLYLKDGTTKLFLLHIEVQGYYDEGFRQRIFQYYYRISDLLGEDIETLAVMIDDDPNWRPNEYIKEFGQTKVHFTFRMFKLLDNPPPYIGKEDNPFSIVFEVAWYGLKKNMFKNDEDLAALKFRLIKQLLANGTETDIIYKMLEFINIYLPFKKPQKEITFDRQIESLIDKEKNMGAPTIRDLYDRKIREDERKMARKELLKTQRAAKATQEKLERAAKATQEKLERATLNLQEEARLRQEEAQLRKEEARLHQDKLKAVVLNLHNQGVSAKAISDMLLEPIALVKKIINNYLQSLQTV